MMSTVKLLGSVTNTDIYVSLPSSSQRDHLIIANLGDSRAVLCTRDDDDQLVPVQLTVDQKPNLPSELQQMHYRLRFYWS